MTPCVLGFVLVAFVFGAIGIRCAGKGHPLAAFWCGLFGGMFLAFALVGAYMVFLEMNPATFGA